MMANSKKNKRLIHFMLLILKLIAASMTLFIQSNHRLHLRKILMEIRNGFDAFIKIGDIELFIRTVQIIAV